MGIPHLIMQMSGKHISSQDGYDILTTAEFQELLRVGEKQYFHSKIQVPFLVHNLDDINTIHWTSISLP
jgi:hypothetical protein